MDGNNDSPPEERPNVVTDAEDQILHILVWMYVARQSIVLTYRAMRFPLLRYITFLNFPRRGLQDVRDFVDAGFYYAGNGDTVFCHRCGFSKGNWVARDSPLDIHRRHAPLCTFYQNDNVVNIHPVFNFPRTKETAGRVNRDDLHGPYPESNVDRFEEQTIEQIELPMANLPGHEGRISIQVSPETSILEARTNSFANDMGVHIRQIRSIYSRRSDIADPINESHGYSHYDNMRSVQNIDIHRRHGPVCTFYASMHSVFNFLRNRENARTVNTENLHGPYPESNVDRFEEQMIEQIELPIANLPGHEGHISIQVSPETSILVARTNSFANDMGVHIRQIRSIYSRRPDIANEMLAISEGSLDSNNTEQSYQNV